jgi:hypothetical protein
VLLGSRMLTIILFKPVFASTAQFEHPDAQTSLRAAVCVHTESARAARGRTSIVAGEGARRDGSRERER